MARRTARENLDIMARAYCDALGVPYHEMGARGMAPVGSWYVRRCDTEAPLYDVVESLEHGAISHPITSSCLTAAALADALYFARLTLAYAPKRGRYALDQRKRPRVTA